MPPPVYPSVNDADRKPGYHFFSWDSYPVFRFQKDIHCCLKIKIIIDHHLMEAARADPDLTGQLPFACIHFPIVFDWKFRSVHLADGLAQCPLQRHPICQPVTNQGTVMSIRRRKGRFLLRHRL